MPVMSLYTVRIELRGAELAGSARLPLGLPGYRDWTVRVVESGREEAPAYTLEAAGLSPYSLAAAECERLDQLLGQIEARVPWQGHFGFDGCTSELTIRGVMSHVSMNWWGDCPPEWHTAGAVVDYVREIEGRLRKGAAEG